jgi:hypothetical protein
VSNIIDFLERLGRDADLRRATDAQVEEALEEAGIEPAGAAAILGNDRQSLETLLQVAGNVCCMVFKEDEEEEEEKEGEEEEEDGEDDEEALLDGQTFSHRRAARVA